MHALDLQQVSHSSHALLTLHSPLLSKRIHASRLASIAGPDRTDTPIFVAAYQEVPHADHF